MEEDISFNTFLSDYVIAIDKKLLFSKSRNAVHSKNWNIAYLIFYKMKKVLINTDEIFNNLLFFSFSLIFLL